MLLMQWEANPRTRDDVPGDTEQEKAQYRVAVRRLIRKFTEGAVHLDNAGRGAR
jgi:hypothetical protein